MGALEFVEELVELFESEFGVDGLAFVALAEDLHLHVDEALAVVLDHAVRRRYYTRT